MDILEKPPPVAIAGIKKSRTRKRCYILAGEAVLGDPDPARQYILIHGVHPQYKNHAWVLDPTDDTIFDTTAWRWFLAAEYPGDEFARYSKEEFTALTTEYGRWGPYFTWLGAYEHLRHFFQR
jgi:hypothetical protein